MSRKPRLRRGLFNTKSGRIRAKNQRIGGKIEGKRKGNIISGSPLKRAFYFN